MLAANYSKLPAPGLVPNLVGIGGSRLDATRISETMNKELGITGPSEPAPFKSILRHEQLLSGRNEGMRITAMARAARLRR